MKLFLYLVRPWRSRKLFTVQAAGSNKKHRGDGWTHCEGRQDQALALSVVEKYIGKPTRRSALFSQWSRTRNRLGTTGREMLTKLQVQSELTTRKSCISQSATQRSTAHGSTSQRELKRTHKDIEIEVVPGVTSMFAIATKAGNRLAEGDETVALVPACYDLERVKRTASACDTVIF